MTSYKKLQEQCSNFNVDHPVGSTVTLRSEYGPIMKTIVSAPASIICGSAVVWIEGVTGFIDIDFVS